MKTALIGLVLLIALYAANLLNGPVVVGIVGAWVWWKASQRAKADRAKAAVEAAAAEEAAYNQLLAEGYTPKQARDEMRAQRQEALSLVRETRLQKSSSNLASARRVRKGASIASFFIPRAGRRRW